MKNADTELAGLQRTAKFHTKLNAHTLSGSTARHLSFHNSFISRDQANNKLNSKKYQRF